MSKGIPKVKIIQPWKLVVSDKFLVFVYVASLLVSSGISLAFPRTLVI